ncbi:MAG: hypothetical protein LBK76_09725 [Verrucomicrobiales bacterium]|jgi:uncharacterized protein involved in exopolysaccharide biosynthesis|nr:hypothetical protein [Verrucomicrobiales bacterium]
MNKKLLIAGVVLILLFPLTLMVGWLYGKSLPKFYSSYATVQVDRDRSARPDADFNPVFLQTEFEIIKSKTLVLPVMQKLGLEEKIRQRSGPSLSAVEIYQLFLRQYLRVRNFRNTRLIEIAATAPDPDEAAAIANAVAEQYVRYRVDQLQELVDHQGKAAPVTIINQAEPNPRPVKPKFLFIMISSLAVGLLALSAGFILLIVAVVTRNPTNSR